MVIGHRGDIDPTAAHDQSHCEPGQYQQTRTDQDKDVVRAVSRSSEPRLGGTGGNETERSESGGARRSANRFRRSRLPGYSPTGLGGLG
jgi:hypothetical protein